MAAKKSVSRKSAAKKKAAKTRKSRAATKKAAKTRKRRVAGKAAAATRKRRAAGKKAAATRKPTAAVAVRAEVDAGAGTPPVQRPRAPEFSPNVAELDQRIAVVRNNLRELVEQTASYSGAAGEELISQRISQQETKLEALIKQRDELAQRGS